MRLIAVVNCYNGARTIERVVSRIQPYVDKVIAYDGCYGDFPVEGRSRRSTDGTLEILRSLNVETIDASRCADQIEKRSMMFRDGQPGDVWIPLDADHWIAQPWRLREVAWNSVDVGWFWTQSNLYAGPYRTARAIKHQPGLHYAGRHHWIFNGRKRLVTSDQNRGMEFKHVDLPITLYNLRQYHENDRLDRKKSYNSWRRKNTEGTFQDESAVYGAQKFLPHPRRAMACCKGFEEISRPKNDSDPTHTMVCPISRPWAVERWFESLSRWEIPASTELLVIVDSEDLAFSNVVRNKLFEHRNSFHGIRLLFTRQASLPEFCRVSNRRDRIISNWQRFLTEARGRILLGAEDDTLPQPDAYTRLLEAYHRTGATFIQGTEVGRWNCNMIPHWIIDTNALGKVSRVATGTFTGETMVRINGGGWYLFACNMDVARETEMRYSQDPPMGPDVCWVYDMASRGYSCFGDWSIEAVHFTERVDLHPSLTPLHQMVTTKLPDGRWNQRKLDAMAWRKLPMEQPPERIPAVKRIPVYTEDGVAVRVMCRALKPFIDEIDWKRGQVSEVLASRAFELERRGLVQILEPDPPPAPPPVPEPEPEPELPSASLENYCTKCGREFKSAQGLATHMRRVH